MRCAVLTVTVLVAGLALAPAPGTAQETLAFAPTWQQSYAGYDHGRVDPLLGTPAFRAWGLMLGAERPGRFWQPHVWFQRYEYGGPPCDPSAEVDCNVDGWMLSVGPGLDFVDTPTLSATVLPQAGLQGRGEGFVGGVGVHVDVKLGIFQPTAFTRYQLIRGVSYGTIGGGLVLRFPVDRWR